MRYLVLITLIIALMVSGLSYLKNHKTEQDLWVQKVLIREANEARAKCGNRVDFIPVQHFPEYSMHCADLSLIEN